MQCELNFQLQNEEKKTTIPELREIVNKKPDTDLLELLKNGKMSFEWPHTRPEPTGEVRAKLIHQRMHKKAVENIAFDKNPGELMTNLSSITIIFITVPCVFISLNAICKWLGFTPEKSKMIGLIGGLISFFAEVGLTIIQLYKKDLQIRRDIDRFENKPTYRKPIRVAPSELEQGKNKASKGDKID